MPQGVRQRLVLALLTVAAVPLLGVGLYTIRTHTRALTELALSAARDRVAQKALRVDELLGELRTDVVFLARSPVMMGLLEGEPGAHERLGRQLLSFTITKPAFASLFYLDEEGDEILRARHDGQRSWLASTEERRRRALAPAFRAAMAQAPGEVFAEALDARAGEAREPVVRYAVRVADRAERRRGVLVADIFARRVVDAVRDSQSTTWLLDEVGWTVSPAAEAPPRTRPEALAAVRDSLRAARTFTEAEAGANVTWALVHPVAPGAAPTWLLAERVPESEVLAEVRRFRVVFGLLAALVAAAAVGLSLVLAGRIARLTEREAAKSEQLEEVSRQLLQSERLAAVGQLAAGVAHEINNPVGVMSMYVQQLLESDRLTETQRRKLGVVERHAARLGRITRGLLDFARDRETEKVRFPAARPARRALEALAPQLEAARVELVLRATEAVEVEGDEDSLQQVFENLLVNAAHAAPGGHVEIVVERAAGGVRLQVCDDGEGIAEVDLPRIFEPFFTTKEVGEGTGLGLAISYGIVKAHGGTMTAANRPEGGARFTVDLPAVDDARREGAA